jgi:transcription elongation factor GreA
MKVTLSQTVFEHLVKHLVRLEEERDNLLDQLFPHICRERTDFEQQLDQYAQHINRVIKNANKSDNDDNNLPFVIVDSDVSVLDLNRQRPLKFHVIGPCPGNKASGCISCLSPVGRSLLLYLEAPMPVHRVH